MIVVAKILMLLTTLMFVSGATHNITNQGKPEAADLILLTFGLLNGVVGVFL